MALEEDVRMVLVLRFWRECVCAKHTDDIVPAAALQNVLGNILI